MAHTSRKGTAPFMEYVRFGITGALNTVTDFIVLNGLLTTTASLGTKSSLYVLCKAASFIVAVVQSYFLNKYWVFRAPKDRGPNMEESSRFFAVSFAGFLLNIAGSALIYSILGAADVFEPRFRANAGALAGTIIVLGWNYVGYKFFVFKTALPRTVHSTTPLK